MIKIKLPGIIKLFRRLFRRTVLRAEGLSFRGGSFRGGKGVIPAGSVIPGKDPESRNQTLGSRLAGRDDETGGRDDGERYKN